MKSKNNTILMYIFIALMFIIVTAVLYTLYRKNGPTIDFYVLVAGYVIAVSGLLRTITFKKKQHTGKSGRDDVKDNEPRQISITITCDEGYTADFLRELATQIENRSDDDDEDPDFEYESFHGCAEITTED